MRTLQMIFERSKPSTTRDSKREESATKLPPLCNGKRMSKTKRWKSYHVLANGFKLTGEA